MSTSVRQEKARPVRTRFQMAETKKAVAVVGAKEEEDGASPHMTAKQAAFVENYTCGLTAGNEVKSAGAAGYGPKGLPQIASRLIKHPKIIAAIDDALREAIGTRLTVKAVNVIETILDSKDATMKLKGDMAAKIIEFSGLVERTKLSKGVGPGSMGGKKLAEMTREELAAVIAQGGEVLRLAAALPAPSGQVIEGELSDNAPFNAPRTIAKSE